MCYGWWAILPTISKAWTIISSNIPSFANTSIKLTKHEAYWCVNKIKVSSAPHLCRRQLRDPSLPFSCENRHNKNITSAYSQSCLPLPWSRIHFLYFIISCSNCNLIARLPTRCTKPAAFHQFVPLHLFQSPRERLYRRCHTSLARTGMDWVKSPQPSKCRPAQQLPHAGSWTSYCSGPFGTISPESSARARTLSECSADPWRE